MSTSADMDGPDDGGIDLTAAEYVAGVLDAAARRRTEARLASDAAFAREVEAWEARLAPLASEAGSVAPPAALWERIVEALPPAAVPDLPRRGAAAKVGLWASLTFWRTAGFGAAAVAVAALVALAIVIAPPAAPPPPLAATLMPQSGKAALMVAVDRARNTLMVMPAALDMPPSRVAELWVIAPGGKPRSLGVVDAARPQTMPIPGDLMPAIAAETMLALSIEPPGGSPTGQPTGPVVASGRLASL